jgi:hypothetical protein
MLARLKWLMKQSAIKNSKTIQRCRERFLSAVPISCGWEMALTVRLF